MVDLVKDGNTVVVDVCNNGIVDLAEECVSILLRTFFFLAGLSLFFLAFLGISILARLIRLGEHFFLVIFLFDVVPNFDGWEVKKCYEAIYLLRHSL